MPGYIIHGLQLVQNAAAKTVADLKKFDHVTHVLQNLNWLPVEKRIMFKLLLLCYKALNGAGPVYLKDMTQITEPKRSGLRSADDVLHLVGVVVQCINHSPVMQEPGVRFQVETMQRQKRLNKQPIKAA